MTNDGGECVIAGEPGNERRTFAKHGAIAANPEGRAVVPPLLEREGLPDRLLVS
jgi:hypothetical protein